MSKTHELRQLLDLIQHLETMTDFMGKGQVESNVRWAAKLLSEQIYTNVIHDK